MKTAALEAGHVTGPPPLPRRGRLPRRATIAVLVAAVLLVGVAVASLSMGQVAVPLPQVLRAAVGVPSDGADFIVGQLRAPRVYTSALVGALLAMSGALLQSVARNPLASPDLLGITAGAAAAAVTGIAVLGTSSSLALAPFAAGGALLTAGLIVVLGWRGGIQPLRMVISGIGVGFVATSITTFLLTRLPERAAGQAYLWTVGTTNVRVWEHVAMGAAALAVLAPLAAWFQRRMRVIEMGDDLAGALGVRVPAVRFAAVGLAALAAGIATALAGPIGFVALVAPAIARRLVGTGSIALGASAVVGALLTVSSDLVARELLAPTQLPIGLVTAAIGAPYLLILLSRIRGAL